MENNYEANIGETIEIEENIKDQLLQKSKKATCKIMELCDNKVINGTAFFAKVKSLNKKFLFTNNHILNENSIKSGRTIKCNYMNRLKIFEIKNRLCFTNIKLDYTCIEIKDEDEIKDFFEIEEKIESDTDYDAEDIAIAQYPKGGTLQIIAGHLITIEGFNIKHLVNTFKGSSGSPIILLLRDFKILGIHSQFCEESNINLGIYIKNIIEDIKRKHLKLEIKEIKNNENEIKFDYIKYHSLLSKCYSNNENIIGIDFGIMNSCVGIMINNKVQIINDIKRGGNLIPSIVYFKNKNEILIGKSAQDNIIQHSESIIFNCKRLIGHKFNDPEIQNYIKNFPMTIIENSDTKKPIYVIKVGNKEEKILPEDACCMIFKYLKKNAEIFTNKQINKAVITVPIQFNIDQRKAIIKVAEFAGLEIVKIISEPIACAIAYNQFLRNFKEKKILIFFFGEDTLNISIIESKKNEYSILASSGEEYFSHEDFNKRLEDYIKDEISKKNQNIDFKNKNDKKIIRLLQKIKRRVEQIIIDLNYQDKSTFYIESLYNNNDFKLEINRKKYEELCMDLWEKCIDKINEAFNYAKLKNKDIDEIILVGNSIKTPKINEIIKKEFEGKKPLKNINCDEVIAYGATISPYLNLKINEILNEGIGIEINGEMNTIIIPPGEIIPFRNYNIKVYSKEFKIINAYSNIIFKIYMGNNDKVCENSILKQFDVKIYKFNETNIIKISMSLNCNFIIKVITEVNDIKNEEINISLTLK